MRISPQNLAKGIRMINAITMRESLEARGIDPASIVEGRGALDWLIDDQGAHISPDPYRNTSPEMVLSFDRVAIPHKGARNRAPFKLNSGLALAPCHTRILWIG